MPSAPQSRRFPVVALWLFRLVLLAVALQASAFALLGQPRPANSVSTANPASFDLSRDRQPVAALDSLWRFQPGDDPAWASPTFDDSSWPLLRSSQPWSTQGYPDLSGYGWYRFTVQIEGSARPVSLLLAPILTSYEIYVDGQHIGTVGDMPPVSPPRAMYQFHAFELPAGRDATDPAPRTVHIALRVWHSSIWSSYVGGGPSRAGSLVGESTLIAAEWRHRIIAGKVIFEDAYVYSLVGTLVGFTILGLFLVRPKEHEYLWFAVLLLSCAADQAIQVIYNVFSLIPVPIYDLIDGHLVAINQAAALAFFSIVLRARRGVLWRITLLLAIISPWMIILYWPGWLSVAAGGALNWIFLLPSSLWILAILGHRAIKGDPDAWLLTIPTGLYFGFFFLYNLALLLSQAGWMVMPDALLDPLPVPPFTMHWQILVDLIFLAALLAFLIRRFAQARQGEERYVAQLEAARQVQQVLLPEAIAHVPGFAVDCIYHPAEEVGGDFFQILPTTQDAGCGAGHNTGHGGLLVIVGDVAGKGLPAAMMVSVLVGAIRAETSHTSDPAAILASLNERMYGRSQGGFTTCICMHLSAEGHVTIASAGHLSPYWIENDVPREVVLNPALPLGIVSPIRYETSAFDLQPGQRLTLVSDGVLEAQTQSGELLGFDRTCQLSTLPAAEIAAAAQQFGQNDDITVVTIEFRGHVNHAQ